MWIARLGTRVRFVVARYRENRRPRAAAAPAAGALPAGANALPLGAIEDLPVIVWHRRPDGRIDFVNTRFTETTGIAPEDAYDWKWTEVLHPGDVAPAMRQWRRAFRLRQAFEIEYRLRGRDGAYRWHIARNVPELDAAGDLRGWLGTCTDIDDRKRSEDDLRLLLDAGTQLLSSLGVRESYAAVARVLVPAHAAWIAITAVDDGGRARLVAARHADGAHNAALQVLIGVAYGVDAGFAGPAKRGIAQVWPALPHDWLGGLPEPARQTFAALGTASALAVPIRQGHRIAGVFTLGRTAAARAFGERDLPIFIELARRVALAESQAENYDNERRVATSFQRAALSPDLPRHGRVVFDAMYEAGQSEALVGGDWYDAFLLVDGRVVVSIGDVSGSGLAAAVTMGLVRQSIRAAARIDSAPLAILDAADRTLRSDQPDRIVTAFVGVFDPFTSEFTYAGAGHPPPLLLGTDGSIVEFAASGAPLGLRRRTRSASAVVTLPAGAIVVLYTDGLIEATRDVFEGERLLREALHDPRIRTAARPANVLHRTVLAGGSRDDVAILTMTVRDAPLAEERYATRRWTLRAGDAEGAVAARHDFTQGLRDAGIPAARIPNAEVVFGELVSNAIRHAGGRIEVRLEWNGRRPVLHVLDDGPGYTARDIASPSELTEAGRGLFLVATLAEDFNVSRRQSGGSHSRAVLACEARAL